MYEKTCSVAYLFFETEIQTENKTEGNNNYQSPKHATYLIPENECENTKMLLEEIQMEEIQMEEQEEDLRAEIIILRVSSYTGSVK